MDYQFLKHINAERDDWYVKVRVVRLWNVYTTKSEHEPIFLEMILLDEKATPLHAAINKNMIPNFQKKIQQGNLYSIKNLKIVQANEDYKPISGSKKAWFLLTTDTRNISESELHIPQHYFEFASLQTLSQRVGEKHMLSDIIGTLHALGDENEEVYVAGKPTKIRRLEIKLKGSEIVKVTLWRNIATEFDQILLNKKEDVGAKTIAITSTLVKKFREEYSINSTSSTRIYINLDMPEFQELKKGNTGEEAEIRELPKQEFANTTPEKRMVRNRTTLKNLKAMKWESTTQERVFTIHATINEIDDTLGWHYVGCEICMKKLMKEENNYKCPKCDKPSKYPTPRFNIKLIVSDETATSKLTLFDKDAQKLLNTTAAQLLQQVGNTGTPSMLQNLCERKLIFEIRLTDQNLKEGSQIYTVTGTFIPNNLLLDQSVHKAIKQEPNSPKATTRNEKKQQSREGEGEGKGKTEGESKEKIEEEEEEEEEEVTLFKGKLKRQPTNKRIYITSSDEQPSKNSKKEIHDIPSSDEEPLLIQSLMRMKKSKTRATTKHGDDKRKNEKKANKN